MGKKKLEISYISDPRRRSSVFFNRRSGIFKKAHDLSKTCGTKVSVILTDLKGNLHVFSNREDVKVHLKKSVVDGAKNDTVQVFRYQDADYPFTNLSHVGRESETFTKKDFNNITMFMKGDIMDGHQWQGQEEENVNIQLLGKRKKLKVLTEKLSKELSFKHQTKINLLTTNPNLRESRLDLTIKELNLDPRNSKERMKSRDENQFEKKSIFPKINDFSEFKIQKQTFTSCFKSEEYHLISLQNIIQQLRIKSSKRSMELDHRLPEVIKSLEDFYQFVGGELSTNWDAFTLDYCAWRYIVAVYFSDADVTAELSELVKRIPVDQFLNFVNMRPPAREERLSPKIGSETTDLSSMDSEQSLPEMAHLAEDLICRSKDYPSIFLSSSEGTMDQLYSIEYLDFIVLLKKYLEVFIQVILRKVEPGPNFNLREQANQITIPVKSKMLKKLVFKKLITIRSAWLLDAIKTMDPSHLDKDFIERIQSATSTNACLEESVEPEILSKMFRDGLDLGILNWITIQELLLTKLLNDLKLYSKTQQIFTSVSMSLGKEKTIEMMLSGLPAQKVFNIEYAKPGDTGKTTAAQKTSANGYNNGVAEDNGLLLDWEAPTHHLEELTQFKRFGAPNVSFEGNDNFINLFDTNADNRSILSFEVPKNIFSG